MAIDLKLPISKFHWIMVVNNIHYVSMKNYLKHLFMLQFVPENI